MLNEAEPLFPVDTVTYTDFVPIGTEMVLLPEPLDVFTITVDVPVLL
jgi:hypothetical protein